MGEVLMWVGAIALAVAFLAWRFIVWVRRANEATQRRRMIDRATERAPVYGRRYTAAATPSQPFDVKRADLEYLRRRKEREEAWARPKPQPTNPRNVIVGDGPHFVTGLTTHDTTHSTFTGGGGHFGGGGASASWSDSSSSDSGGSGGDSGGGDGGGGGD